jgi:putative ABC transport system permease protein
VKAVSPGYPLRGQLRITTSRTTPARRWAKPRGDTPAPGTVWVDANLLPA